jgi:hypothetical protein
MSAHSDDDLLRPSLTEEDDAIGFDRPWDPSSLVMLAFFGGLVAGGGLLALNFRRLGLKDRFVPALLTVALSEIVWTCALIWLIGYGSHPLIDFVSWRSYGLAAHIFTCFLALVMARFQQKRYRLFKTRRLPDGKLFVPALAALAVGLVVNFVELFIVFMISS